MLRVVACVVALFVGGAVAPGSTFCCGVPGKVSCGSPDFTQMSFAMHEGAGALWTTTDFSTTLDGTKTVCKGEAVKVTGKDVAFPNIAKKTDCVGKMVTGTGALPSDLKVTYDSAAKTVTVDIDSQGLTVLMKEC